MNAIRSMTGGKRVVPSTKQRSKAEGASVRLKNNLVAKKGISVVQFTSEVFMVSEGDGKVDAIVKREPAVGKCVVA